MAFTRKIKRLALVAGVSVTALTSAAVATVPAHAAVGSQVCGIGRTLCLNRSGGGTTQGSTHMITYTNDGDSNEYATVDYINPCNSTPADEVTQTCPFTVGSGLNSANAGDLILQVHLYSGSGLTSYGCLGTNGNTGSSAYRAYLEKCNSAAGSGGGTGTIFVLGRGNSGGFPSNVLVNRYSSNDDINSGSGVLGTLGNPDSCALVNTGWLTVNADNPGCQPVQWSIPGH